ncbi:MAG: hypothetical protein V8R91_06605 [Butyricimonas faecihominis]
MKKTFILLFVAILPLLASAQKEEVKVTVVEEESTAPWRGFVTNRFWDNWFISIGAGGQVYFGEMIVRMISGVGLPRHLIFPWGNG